MTRVPRSPGARVVQWGLTVLIITVLVLAPPATVLNQVGIVGGQTGTAPTQEWDFGDAPATTYPSAHTQNGARHRDTTQAYLGTAVTTETESQQVDADFDDGLLRMDPLEIEVTRAGYDGALYLNVLADYDDDGAWEPSESTTANTEWVLQNLEIPANYIRDGESHTIRTEKAVANASWVRVTLTGAPIDAYDGRGSFAIGETEDYGPSASPRNTPPPINISVGTGIGQPGAGGGQPGGGPGGGNGDNGDGGDGGDGSGGITTKESEGLPEEEQERLDDPPGPIPPDWATEGTCEEDRERLRAKIEELEDQIRDKEQEIGDLRDQRRELADLETQILELLDQGNLDLARSGWLSDRLQEKLDDSLTQAQKDRIEQMDEARKRMFLAQLLIAAATQGGSSAGSQGLQKLIAAIEGMSDALDVLSYIESWTSDSFDESQDSEGSFWEKLKDAYQGDLESTIRQELRKQLKDTRQGAAFKKGRIKDLQREKAALEDELAELKQKLEAIDCIQDRGNYEWFETGDGLARLNDAVSRAPPVLFSNERVHLNVRTDAWSDFTVGIDMEGNRIAAWDTEVTDPTVIVTVSGDTLRGILESENPGEVAMAAHKRGDITIRSAGSLTDQATYTAASRLGRAVARITALTRDNPYAVGSGETATVSRDVDNDGQPERATVERNAVGHTIVSTEDTDRVEVVNDRGEVVGVSTVEMQRLMQALSGSGHRGHGLSDTAGVHSSSAVGGGLTTG